MPEVRPIDADALKKDLLEQAKMNEEEENYDKAAEDRVIIDYLRLVPAIDAAPVRHGEWIDVGLSFMAILVCSNCGNRAIIAHDPYPYCPNCGAKMDGGKNT